MISQLLIVKVSRDIVQKVKKITKDSKANSDDIKRRDLISDSPTFVAHISARIFLLQLTSDWNSSSSNTFDLT